MNKTRIKAFIITMSIWSGIVIILDISYVQINRKYIAFHVSENSTTVLRETSRLGNGLITIPACNASSLTSIKNGTVYVNLTVPSWAYLHEHVHTNLPGGHYRPTTCVPEYRTAIIIPHRNREHQVRGFLQHIHPFLQRQRIEYKIFVVELVPDIPFNRAILMNIGFVESIKSDNFSCFIFHDVDLLPEDIRHLYVCGSSPIHMSVAQSNHKYKIEHHKMEIVRRSILISRYRMMDHKQEQPASDRSTFLKTRTNRFDQDGLNSLNYTVVKHEDRKLYTWILVSVNMTEIRAPWPIPVRKPRVATLNKKKYIAKQRHVHKA